MNPDGRRHIPSPSEDLFLLTPSAHGFLWGMNPGTIYGNEAVQLTQMSAATL
jgi:hypothetical protein